MFKLHVVLGSILAVYFTTIISYMIAGKKSKQALVKRDFQESNKLFILRVLHEKQRSAEAHACNSLLM